MLTISELASYAGVTVRAVRHYHAIGLLPEPDRDRSGYRRYDAHAVVALIRIRILADAGVPLSRVQQLLAADEDAFAAAVAEIDRRLQAEIRDRQRHRERIARLAAGDSLALPPEFVAYLDRLRELGFLERVIEVERDSWILIAAQAPEHLATLMELKRQQIEVPEVRALYLDIGEIFDCDPDDPRLPVLVDRVVAFVEAAAARVERAEELQERHAALEVRTDDADWLTEELVALLDAAFVASFPSGPRLLELLEERGWTGWTNMRRIER